MARIITNEQFYHDYEGRNIPVWGYGVEADTYEEAKALAERAFNRDLTEYLENIEEQTETAPQEIDLSRYFE